MRLLALFAIGAVGCTGHLEVSVDTGEWFKPVPKPSAAPTVESRDCWLDGNGRVLAQDHGWTLTMVRVDAATPGIALYHLTRSLVPLPAERP